MSKRPDLKSSEVPSHQASDSVFDFLYHDARRIGSFLAQFDPAGVLQSLKRTRSVSQSYSSTADDELTLGVGVAKAEFKEVGVDSKGDQDGSEKQYDPLWSNARAFLDYLQQRSLLVRDVKTARMGQIALLEGDLSVLDLGLLKEAWSLPIFRATAGVAEVERETQNRHERRANPPRAAPLKTADSHPVEFAFEMMGILPHAIQARLTSSQAASWCTLQPDCLTTSASDLLMKHGLQVPGRWQMIGIVDGLANEPNATPIDMDREVALHGPVAAMYSVIAPVARQMLGRPANFYALTPLLIFREVSTAI